MNIGEILIWEAINVSTFDSAGHGVGDADAVDTRAFRFH